MKTFNEYIDGELVFYKNGSIAYSAYKSEYTENAFRLKAEGHNDVIADITEISPVGIHNSNFNSQGEPQVHLSNYPPPLSLYGVGHVDSDADSSGIYGVDD